MKAIQKHKFSHMQHAEHYQFNDDVLCILAQEMEGRAELAALIGEYRARFATERKAFPVRRGYQETKEIRLLDKERNERYLRLKQLVDSLLRHPDEAMRTAAKSIAFVLKEFRYIYLRSHSTKSAELTRLVSLLNKEKYAEEVTTLGIASVVADLEASNQAFRAAYSLRKDEKRRRHEAVKMKEIRPKVDEAYRRVVAAINALYAANALAVQDPEVETLFGRTINRINGVVIQLRETLSRRAARAENAAANDEASDEENTIQPTQS